MASRIIPLATQPERPNLPAPRWEWISRKAAESLVSDDNRAIRPSVVKEYARLMDNNLWALSPHGICIGDDGKCADGNHRVSALARSSVEGAWFLVTRWPVRPMDLRVDRGAGRSLSDYTALSSYMQAPLTYLATAAGIGGQRRLDPTEIAPVVRAFLPFAEQLKAASGSITRVLSSGYVRAAFILAMARTNDDDAAVIADQYAKLVRGDEGKWPSMISLSKQLGHTSLTVLESSCRAYLACTERDRARITYSPEIAAQMRDDILDTLNILGSSESP